MSTRSGGPPPPPPPPPATATAATTTATVTAPTATITTNLDPVAVQVSAPASTPASRQRSALDRNFTRIWNRLCDNPLANFKYLQICVFAPIVCVSAGLGESCGPLLWTAVCGHLGLLVVSAGLDLCRYRAKVVANQILVEAGAPNEVDNDVDTSPPEWILFGLSFIYQNIVYFRQYTCLDTAPILTRALLADLILGHIFWVGVACLIMSMLVGMFVWEKFLDPERIRPATSRMIKRIPIAHFRPILPAAALEAARETSAATSPEIKHPAALSRSDDNDTRVAIDVDGHAGIEPAASAGDLGSRDAQDIDAADDDEDFDENDHSRDAVGEGIVVACQGPSSDLQQQKDLEAAATVVGMPPSASASASASVLAQPSKKPKHATVKGLIRRVFFGIKGLSSSSDSAGPYLDLLPEDAVCSICLGEYEPGERLRLFACDHHLHVDCCDRWLKVNAKCPMCKHDITRKIKKKKTHAATATATTNATATATATVYTPESAPSPASVTTPAAVATRSIPASTSASTPAITTTPSPILASAPTPAPETTAASPSPPAPFDWARLGQLLSHASITGTDQQEPRTEFFWPANATYSDEAFLEAVVAWRRNQARNSVAPAGGQTPEQTPIASTGRTAGPFEQRRLRYVQRRNPAAAGNQTSGSTANPPARPAFVLHRYVRPADTGNARRTPEPVLNAPSPLSSSVARAPESARPATPRGAGNSPQLAHDLAPQPSGPSAAVASRRPANLSTSVARLGNAVGASNTAETAASARTDDRHRSSHAAPAAEHLANKMPPSER